MTSFIFGILFCSMIIVIGYHISNWLHPKPVTPHTTEALTALANNINEARFVNGLIKATKNINKAILNAAYDGKKHISLDLPNDVSERLWLDSTLNKRVISHLKKKIVHKGDFTIVCEVARFGCIIYTVEISW